MVYQVIFFYNFFNMPNILFTTAYLIQLHCNTQMIHCYITNLFVFWGGRKLLIDFITFWLLSKFVIVAVLCSLSSDKRTNILSNFNSNEVPFSLHNSVQCSLSEQCVCAKYAISVLTLFRMGLFWGCSWMEGPKRPPPLHKICHT